MSFALDVYPPPPGADPDVALWKRNPGHVNPAMLELSPDHRGLQTVFWNLLALSIAFNVTGRGAYAERGRALLDTAFLGAKALAPHMRYARMIPTVSLEDSRPNILGFHEMDDVPLALDAAALLPLSAEDRERLNVWMRCAPSASVSTGRGGSGGESARADAGKRRSPSSAPCGIICMCPRRVQGVRGVAREQPRGHAQQPGG